MKGKWVLAIAILGLFLTSDLLAQYQPNELLLNAGSRFWYGTGAGGWGFPNHGLGKYYPSFTHWAATKDAGGLYTTKVDGWGWSAMQGGLNSTIWFFSAALHKSFDYPYLTVSPHMLQNYPKNYCTGAMPHTGFTNWMWGGTLPGNVPAIGGNHAYVFPSTYGGEDAYWNVFFVFSGSIIGPLPSPFSIWVFTLAGDCTAPATIPSTHSIWEYVWTCRPQAVANQYLLISGDEYDSTGTTGLGNKGRPYTWIGDVDNGYYWGWLNGCTGAPIEAGFGVFLCDSLIIPVNMPGNPIPINPYASLGFDQGIATICPLASSGTGKMKFMTLNNQWPGKGKGPLASLQYPPNFSATPWNWNNQELQYGTKGYRIPHKWDSITTLFANSLIVLFSHTPVPGFPSYFFTSCVGASGLALPIPVNPFLLCLELHFSGYGPGAKVGPTAGFMATYF